MYQYHRLVQAATSREKPALSRTTHRSYLAAHTMHPTQRPRPPNLIRPNPQTPRLAKPTQAMNKCRCQKGVNAGWCKDLSSCFIEATESTGYCKFCVGLALSPPVAAFDCTALTVFLSVMHMLHQGSSRTGQVVRASGSAHGRRPFGSREEAISTCEQATLDCRRYMQMQDGPQGALQVSLYMQRKGGRGKRALRNLRGCRCSRFKFA